MYKETLDAFGRFWEAYTKKEHSPYNEKEAFEHLCNAMRKEKANYEKRKKNAAKYVAERREIDPNYARPEREWVEIKEK